MWKFEGTEITIDDSGKMCNGHATNFHFDVNGKWGGAEACLAFAERANNQPGVWLVYALVGAYEEVGLWPDQEPPSRMHLVRVLTHALRDGVSPALLEKHIEAALAEHRAAQEFTGVL